MASDILRDHGSFIHFVYGLHLLTLCGVQRDVHWFNFFCYVGLRYITIKSISKPYLIMVITYFSFRYNYKWQTALKIEAAGSSKMLVPVYQKMFCHVPVDVQIWCDGEWNIYLINCVSTDDSVDSGLETEAPDQQATYIMMDARDRLEITLTPAALQVLHSLATAFTRTIPDIPAAAYHGLEAPLSLQNDLGPWAKITLLSRAEVCCKLV